MPGPRKKPVYDSEKIMKELISAVVDSYNETGELKLTSEELGMSALKVRKLLITAGVYSNDICDEAPGEVAEKMKISGFGGKNKK